MPQPKRFSRLRSFQTYMGTPRGFIIPNAIKSVNYRLLKLGYYGLTLRSMELLGQLAKAGLYNDNLVQHYMAFNGVQQSANAVSSWLNLAPSRISLNKNLTQATAANMPTWLRHTAAEGNYGYLNGTSGNSISTPDSATIQPTTEIDIRVRASLPNWTSLVASDMFGKFDSAGNQRSYIIGKSSAGAGFLTLIISRLGSGSNTAVSTAGVSFSANQIGWIRATWRASDQRTQFFTAPDSTGMPTVWTQLGGDVSMGGAPSSIFDGTAPLIVGGKVDQNTNTAGNYYYADVRIAIDGLPVGIFDASLYTNGTTLSSLTGETWTINGGGVIVTVSALYFDGVNDFLTTGSFVLNQPQTIYLVGRQVSWTVQDVIFDGNTNNSCKLYQQNTSPGFNATAGNVSFVGTNNNWPIATNAIVTFVVNGSTSSTSVNRTTPTLGNAGSGVSNGFTLGAEANLSNFANMTISEILIFNQLLSPAQDAVVLGYLNEKYNLGL